MKTQPKQLLCFRAFVAFYRSDRMTLEGLFNMVVAKSDASVQADLKNLE